MICTQYIHGIDMTDSFQYECYHFWNELHDYEKQIIALECQLEERKFFNENVDEFMAYMESEKKNIFEKIGGKIIELGKSFVETIDKIIKTIKEKLFGVKKLTNDEKYLKMMQDDPEFATKFKEAIASGNLKMNDFKDINALIDEANKIGNDYLNGKIDDKTFSKTMDEKIKRTADKAKDISTILGVVGATVTAATAVSRLSHGISETSDQAIQARNNLRDAEDNARRFADSGGDANRLNRWAAYHGRLMELTSRNVGALGRATRNFYDLIERRTGGYHNRPLPNTLDANA